MVSPTYKNIVTLDVPNVTLQQPSFVHDLSMDQIASSSVAPTDVIFYSGIGWKLAEYQAKLSYQHETSVADSSIVPVTSAPGVLTKSMQRAETELSGVDYSNVRTSGDVFLRKDVSASGSFGDAVLTADQTAFPSSNTPSALIQVDRLHVSTGNHLPNETVWLRFIAPAAAHQSTQRLGGVYFTSLPGQLSGEANPGDGHYYVDFWNDGTAYITERFASGTWKIRKEFLWCSPNQVAGNTHVIAIRTDARLNPTTNLWEQSLIAIESRSIPSLGTTYSSFFNGVLNYVQNSLRPSQEIYYIPGPLKKQPALDKLRIDIRRNIRAYVQIAKSYYRTPGKIQTKNIVFPFKTFGTNYIYVTVYGDFPNGCTCPMDLYCADTGATCTFIGQNFDPAGKYVQNYFAPVSGKQTYYAVLNPQTTDQTKSPTLKRCTCYRPPQATTRTGTPLVIPVSTITATGPDADPSHETMSFLSKDANGVLGAKLDNRAMMTVAWDVQIHPTDTSKWSRIFYGRVAKATKDIKGYAHGGTNIPVSRWGVYNAVCVGEWERLNRAKIPRRYNLLNPDADGIAPLKITTIIRDLLRTAGYIDQQIDIPISTKRFYAPVGTQLEQFLETFTEIGPFLVDLIRNYLGGYLIWDSNATNGGGSTDVLGCWRVKIPPSPPYNVLADFYYSAQNTGPISDFAAWPDVVSGGQHIKQTFIRKWTVRPYIEPPEGNFVIVDGVVSSGSTLGSAQSVNRRVFYNYKAGDFGQSSPYPSPDPTHPDYTDGEPRAIYINSAALISDDAVVQVGRRTFDLSCHARQHAAFEAPAIFFTDSTDSLQIRPRLPRFGDIVRINGSVYVIQSCNPLQREGHSGFMTCAYEVFNVPALTSAYTFSGNDELFKAIALRGQAV